MRGRATALVGLAVAAASVPAAHASFTLRAFSGHRADPTSIDRLREVALDTRIALPRVWCGPNRSTDDSASAVDNGSPKLHAVYAVAQDAPDRLQTVGGTIQTDAFQASALLESLYGRALRFDMGTSCGSQYLDITDVRLPQSSAQLAQDAQSGALLEDLRGDLRSAGFDVADATDSVSAARGRPFDFVVWLDGPDVAGLCGQASLYPDTRAEPDNLNAFGGKLAVVFRDGETFCNSNAVRHEVGHELGALMPGAPHAFDGAHCNDAYEDTMCYPDSPVRGNGTFGGQYFDYGNDDYWALAGHPLGRWTLDMSPFICPDVSCNVPGGSVSGNPLDNDGDSIPDAVDQCPGSDDLNGLDLSGSGCQQFRDSRPQGHGARSAVAASLRAVRIHLRRRARYRITVRCGKRVAKHWRGTGPRQLVLRVHCSRRPRFVARVSR